MNKKVFVSMLILCTVFLVISYVLKIFFPQEFVMAVENKQIIKIAKFIDSNIVLYYLFGILTSFLTYWIYCCACSHRLYLKWYECLIILGVVIITLILSKVDLNLMSAISTCAFVFLPALMRGDLKTCAIVYTAHGINQCLTLTIRNLTMYTASASRLVMFILSIDLYIWLLVAYALFNYKEKKEI